MAAVGLNLILGYGGMVSFGHAAYLGIGGYAVGILPFQGVGSAACMAGRARRVGAVRARDRRLSLRTRGVYFIMITLAFAQMFYFLAIGLEALWRRRRPDDQRAQPLRRRSISATSALFYYLCFALLLVASICSAGSSIRASAWCCAAHARTSGGCWRSAFPTFATSSSRT